MSKSALSRNHRFAAIVALTMVSATGGAYAMDPSKDELVSCKVVGVEKMLAEAGGSANLCERVRSEAAVSAPGIRFAVEIRAPSTDTLAAKILLSDGRVLPDLKITMNDRKLDRVSVGRFASAIVTQAAEASRS